MSPVFFCPERTKGEGEDRAGQDDENEAVERRKRLGGDWQSPWVSFPSGEACLRQFSFFLAAFYREHEEKGDGKSSFTLYLLCFSLGSGRAELLDAVH